MSIPSRCRYGPWAFTWTQTLGAWSDYHEVSFKWRKKNNGVIYMNRSFHPQLWSYKWPQELHHCNSHNFGRVLEGQRVEGSCQNLRRRALTSLSCKANCRGKARVSVKMFCLSLFFFVICSVLWKKDLFASSLLLITLYDNFIQKVFQ